jgi:prepilin-type N-terminal cleavage/methylation domain-containing protein
MASSQSRNQDFMQTRNSRSSQAAGFSLLELLIAMAITLVLMGASSTLLVSSLNVRTRENQRTAAIADAQRALNSMSREVANSGFGLNGNGIVAADSSATSIRVRANLNATSGETTSNTASDRDEDVKYMLYFDTTNSYIVRLDINTAAQEMILANRVDALAIRYYADKVYYNTGNCDISNVTDAAGNSATEVAQKSSAKYVVISLCVTLPQVSSPGSPGYQPASRVQLTSDVTLNNSNLVNF